MTTPPPVDRPTATGEQASPATGGRHAAAVAIIVGFLALLALLLYGVRQSDRVDRESLPSPLIGRPAPQFSLPLLHEPGREVGSAELLGEPYLLNVWGSWCPACRVEHPVLERYAASGAIRVIGYNWKDEREDALRWLQQFGDPYTMVLADYEGRSAIDWGIYGAPETFLVDAEGIVRWKYVGPLTDDVVDGELAPLVAKLGGAK